MTAHPSRFEFVERFIHALELMATEMSFGAHGIFARALIRELYFDLCTDPATFNGFISARNPGGLGGYIGVSLANDVPLDPDRILSPNVDIKYWLGKKAKAIYWNWNIRRNIFAPTKVEDAPDVLVMAISARHLRYIAPLLLKLQGCLNIAVADTYSEVAKAAEEIGIKVAYTAFNWYWEVKVKTAFPNLSFMYEYAQRAIAIIRPRTVLLVEGNSPFDELVRLAAVTQGVKTVCVQQGWSPIVHVGFRQLKFDSMLVWGDMVAELLAPFSPQQNFVTSGAILEARRCTPSPGLKARTIAFFLHGRGVLIPDKANADILSLLIVMARIHHGLQFLVREHPAAPIPIEVATQLSTCSNIKLCPANKFPLHHVLESSGMAVSIHSTTLLEALMFETIPLVVNIIGMPSLFPDIAASGCALEAKSISDAEAMIGDFAKGLVSFNVEEANKFCKKFFNKNENEDLSIDDVLSVSMRELRHC